MAGRKGMKWANRTLNADAIERIRSNIEAMKIVNRLNSLILGDIEMPPHAVTAAIGLLRKVLPDLHATSVSGDVSVIHYSLAVIESKLLHGLASNDSQGTLEPAQLDGEGSDSPRLGVLGKTGTDSAG